jgi:hypothetical protein
VIVVMVAIAMMVTIAVRVMLLHLGDARAGAEPVRPTSDYKFLLIIAGVVSLLPKPRGLRLGYAALRGRASSLTREGIV